MPLLRPTYVDGDMWRVSVSRPPGALWNLTNVSLCVRHAARYADADGVDTYRSIELPETAATGAMFVVTDLNERLKVASKAGVCKSSFNDRAEFLPVVCNKPCHE